MPWLEDPVAAVSALPALALLLPLFVMVSALLEFVVPPYWGDLVMLLGFFLSGQEKVGVSPWTIFAAAVAGSILGAVAAFLLGRRYGLRVARRIVPWRPSGTRERIRELLLRFGPRFLVVNRFVPVIRGLLLYGAGAMRLRFADVFVHSTLGSLIWVTMLMGLGLLTAGSWEEILATFQLTHRIVAGVVGVVAVAWIAFIVWRLRMRREVC